MSNGLQKNLEGFDDYYNKPSWWFRFRYSTQIKRRTCLYLLKKSSKKLSKQRVLDVGFGSGDVLFSFEKNCSLVGVEISRSAVKYAKKLAKYRGFKDVELRVSQDSLLRFKPNSFDIVIASHLLEHVDNDDQILEEIKTILKPDGVVIILIPINEKYDDVKHIRKYTTEKFIKFATDNGFKIDYYLENELLFHIVEKFYYYNYNKKWKILGPIITLLFNIPSSLLPIRVHKLINPIFKSFDFKPRQAGFLLSKFF